MNKKLFDRIEMRRVKREIMRNRTLHLSNIMRPLGYQRDTGKASI